MPKVLRGVLAFSYGRGTPGSNKAPPCAGAYKPRPESGLDCVLHVPYSLDSDYDCVLYRGYSKLRTHTALGPYSRASPRSIGPA